MSKLSQLVKKERSERILTFDLMRGFFLCVILFNHLWYYPSGLEPFTGRSILYISTAEGFFVVSGIVLGIVRGRKLLGKPFKVAAKLLWKRALQLYLTSIILTFLFTAVGQLFLDNPGLKWGVFSDWSHWWTLIIDTVTLSYTYGWADFLRLYAIFIFFTPIALWLLRKGLWYVMLLASFGVWMLYPLFADNTMTAQPMSWQFIFMSGFAIGFYWEKIIAAWRALPLARRKLIGRSFVGIFALTYVLSFMFVFGYEISGPVGAGLESAHHGIEQYFNKDRLSIPRMILGATWFWAFFYIIRRYEKVVADRLGWLLLPLGTNSLYVYTISAFIVFFMHLAYPAPGFGNVFLNLIASLGALSLVYVAVRTKFLMKIIPR